jgi:hypothetical protein
MKNSFGFTLMPFLDILFAAIGVFIIIFSIQDVLLKKQTHAAQSDILIICKENGYIFLLHKEQKELIAENSDEIFKQLNNYIIKNETAPNLLIAIKPDGFELWDRLEHKLDELTKIDKKKEQKLKTNIVKVLWPLSDTNEAEQELIKKWQNNELQYRYSGR